MCETAALLVDHRLPAVPWRQWVLSFEGSMATRLGYDKQLLSLVCQRFAKRVMQTLRRQTKREHGLATQSTLHCLFPTYTDQGRAHRRAEVSK